MARNGVIILGEISSGVVSVMERMNFKMDESYNTSKTSLTKYNHAHYSNSHYEIKPPLE